MADKNYKIIFNKDTGDDYGVVEEVELQTDSYDEVKEYLLKNQDREKSITTLGYENKRDSYFSIYDIEGNNITPKVKQDIEDIKKEKSLEQFSEIKITSTANLKEPLKSQLKQDVFFQDDDAKTLIQVLAKADELIKEQSLKNLEFSKQSISLRIKDGDRIQNLEVKLGEGRFKDLKTLINTSSMDLNRDKPVITEDVYKDIIEKNGKDGSYKNPPNLKSLDNIFNSGIDGLMAATQTLGDEYSKEFINGFSKAFKGFGNKTQTIEKPEIKEPVVKKKEPIKEALPSKLEKAAQELQRTSEDIIKNGKIRPKTKEKTRSKDPTDIGR